MSEEFMSAQSEPLEQDGREVDILKLLRRWTQQLTALPEPDRKLVLHFLNQKFGA